MIEESQIEKGNQSKKKPPQILVDPPKKNTTPKEKGFPPLFPFS